MPRGHKSKLHAREKRSQARGEAQACRGAQEPAKETPEAAEESSAASQSQPAAESSSSLKTPQKAAPSASTALSISSSESDENFCEENDTYEEEEECPFELNPCPSSPHQDIIAKKSVAILRCLLHNYYMKQPSTKEEMLKIITKKYENDFPEIFRKASEKLEEAFAMEVREVNSSEPSYNLISKLKLPNNGRIRAGKGLPKTGFLMSVLSIIFVSGNCASEEDMWKILRKRQIYPGKKHRIFGEPRKLMTQYFVKLKYLEYRQVANSDPPRYEFLWGPQAYAEISKIKVLEFLAKINETTPSAIADTYFKSLKNEQEQAEAQDEGRTDTTDSASGDSPVKLPASSSIPFDV
ncbi:melanoma-associated antigen B5-like [Microtus pennsylvanicus]|uniref:melanoma-associated antigen B5-like n=1 Tax=Microtus pennsylvanicus TaxID=10058 RepID=UPI003F6BD514